MGKPDEKYPQVGISQNDAEVFATKLEKAMNNGDSLFIDYSFDFNGFFDRLTEGLTTTDADRESFMEGRSSQMSLGGKLAQVMKDGGDVRLLRVYWNGEEPRGLYRRLDRDGNLDYIEFVLSSRDSGFVEIIDLFMYNTGELFSSSMRRLIETDPGSAMERRISPDLNEAATRVQAMTELARRGEYQSLLRQYDAAPGRLKNDKFVQLLRLRAALVTGEIEYKAALADVRTRFPNDPSLNRIMIDHYYLQKQYDSMLVMVERLDSSLGGDPYLDLYRGVAATGKEDYNQARIYLEKVIADHPMLLLPYYYLIPVRLKLGDHAGVVRIMELIETRSAGVFDSELIESSPEYKDFARSDEYRAWLKSRSRK